MGALVSATLTSRSTGHGAPQPVHSDRYSLGPGRCPALNRRRALGRTCSVSFSGGIVGSDVGGAQIPWLSGRWTKDATSLPVPGGLGCHCTFQQFLLIPEGQTEGPGPPVWVA